MKIYVISARSIFSPAASTNRMLSLAKGLAAAGCAVKIFCLGPAGKANAGKISGEMDGITYTHLGGRTGVYANILPGKIIHFFAGALDGCRVFKKKDRPDAVLLLSIRLIHLFPYLWIAEKHSIPVFHERNEYPHRNARTAADRFLLQLYLERIVPRFAGLALMTKALIKYFSENCSRCPPMVHLPMTVDPGRFLTGAAPPIPDRYIAHCGSSFGDKDGVPILVEAFARVAPSFPDLKLVLIGSDSDKNATERLQKRIYDLGIQKRVVLTGQITRDEMPAWLTRAEALALARPANLQAEGGFPTKLGEYLSTGRPVVVTRVGEIPDYLQDGVNAWLAEPGSVPSFAEKLFEVLSLSAEIRNATGRCGRDVARSVFDFAVQGRRFAEFIEEQVKNCRSARA